MKKILLLLLASVMCAFSAPVTLAWNANSETNIASYKLSYGTSTGTYTSSVDAGTAIQVTTPDLASGTYFFTVQAINTAGLPSPYSAEVVYTVDNTPYVSPKGYTVTADSEGLGDYQAKYAIDGNTSTFWHTNWTTNVTPAPHELIVNLGAVKKIKAFTYLQRQDAFDVGCVKDYEFFISQDGVTWGNAVSKGALTNVKTLITINITPTSAKFVKFKGLSDFANSSHMAVAEFDVVEYVDLPPAAPTGLKVK